MSNDGRTIAEQAERLAAAGRVAEALSLLAQGAERRDAEACFTLAVWRLAGRAVPRDLALAREMFGRAAAAGHPQAGAVYRAFVANGTGGPRQWREALRLLRSSKDANARRQLEIISAMHLTEDGDSVAVSPAEILSESPSVSLLRSFMTPRECDYLADAASPLFSDSVVVDPATGRLVRDPVRTSEAAAFPLALEDPLIHALNRRIGAASGTDPAQGEPLQVLRYRPGQEYKAHSDALPGGANQRILTMLVYLNDGYQGGETLFLENGLSIKGNRGDAILFRNADLTGRPDPAARHAGLPVRRGVKLLASRWIRAKPLDLTGGMKQAG
ncbi:MAG TPA: 2OG-Fe(II) oxygenase [Allosphingosinicella sp.]|jgi:prolyl 4-hydroxylase